MASISASSFIKPRLASQILGDYLIDMVGRSGDSKVYVLHVIIDADRIEIYGSKEILGADGDDLLRNINLPRKMTLAMYHLARAKGYLR